MPPGRADIRRKAGSPAPSDVTVQTTCITNSGRTAAAGMVPGAWIVVQVFQTQQSGRVPQVGPDGSPAMPLQGSGGVVRCATGGAGRNRRARKRRRALARHDGVPACSRGARRFLERCTRGQRGPVREDGSLLTAFRRRTPHVYPMHGWKRREGCTPLPPCIGRLQLGKRVCSRRLRQGAGGVLKEVRMMMV